MIEDAIIVASVSVSAKWDDRDCSIILYAIYVLLLIYIYYTFGNKTY